MTRHHRWEARRRPRHTTSAARLTPRWLFGLGTRLARYGASAGFGDRPRYRRRAQCALPHTDGADLASNRPAPTAAERQQQLRAVQRACEGPCVTPFGARLGVADGVEARSNCGSTCLHLEYSFVDRDSGQLRVALQSPDPRRFEYAGVTYQCVEYARRWWIRNRGLTFGTWRRLLDTSRRLQRVRACRHEPLPLGRSLNGSAQRAPERGDLVIYGPDLFYPTCSGMSRSSWRWMP